jgi:hypothetical protein
MGDEEVVHHHHHHQIVDAEVLQKRVGLGTVVMLWLGTRFLIIVWAVSARLHTIFT